VAATRKNARRAEGIAGASKKTLVRLFYGPIGNPTAKNLIKRKRRVARKGLAA